MYDDYEYRQNIRKYATCDVLKHYAKESIDVYNNTDNNVKFEDVSIYNKKTGTRIKTHRFDITQ